MISAVLKGFQKALHVPRFIGQKYARFSDAWPHTSAGLTAFFILGSADITAQFLERRYGNRAGGWNARRTLSLVSFGVFYYGGPCKFFYLRYPAFFDRMIPKSPKPVKKMAAAFVDCGIVTPLLLLPSFYLITMSIKGESLAKIWHRYRTDFVEVTLGTFVYWFPIVTTNFYFIPQHSQILVIVVGSFIHKCWLSWVSNRYTNPNQSDNPYSTMFKKGENAVQQGMGVDNSDVIVA